MLPRESSSDSFSPAHTAPGTALIVIALIWAAIKMVVASGGNEREKVKSDIFRILLCGVGLGAVIVIISLMLSIGAKVGE